MFLMVVVSNPEKVTSKPSLKTQQYPWPDQHKYLSRRTVTSICVSSIQHVQADSRAISHPSYRTVCLLDARVPSTAVCV